MDIADLFGVPDERTMDDLRDENARLRQELEDAKRRIEKLRCVIGANHPQGTMRGPF